MKSREEVEALKRSWLRDPCYDLAWADDLGTHAIEGFEPYAGELLCFQLRHEREWKEKCAADRALVKRDGSCHAFPSSLAEGLTVLEYMTTHIAAAVATDYTKTTAKDAADIADIAVKIAEALILRLAKQK